MARKLKTAKDVIHALGGPKVLAPKFEVGRTAVVNWASRQKIMPETYVAMQHMLKSKGDRADPALWGMFGT